MDGPLQTASRQAEFEAYRPTLELAMGEPLSIDGLTHGWRIFQRLKGHRHSIDDALTGWYALQKGRAARSYLDLGTGVGTVGLIVLQGLDPLVQMTCIEAQEVSYALLKANIQCNGLSSRVEARHGDLRALALEQKFELITGSPPYFPTTGGTLPRDGQKAHARFELRGHVGDYARAAKAHLAPGGQFVYCFPFQQKVRGMALVEAEGFRLIAHRDVHTRYGEPPLFSLFAASLDHTLPTVAEPPFHVYQRPGLYTDEMVAAQLSRGFGPDGTNILK